MFKALKKYLPFQSSKPQVADEAHTHTFTPAAASNHENVNPPPRLVRGQDGVYAPLEKPSLGKRILQGLPGFATSAGTVMAAKAGVASLLAGVSSTALLPTALTAGAAIGAGAFASQTVNHFRDRWNKVEAERGEKISLRTLVKEFNMATVKREASVFGQELKSKRFWKDVAVKGGISAALGTAFGFAASSETVHDVLHKAHDYVGNFFARPAIPVTSSVHPSHILAQENSAAAMAPAAPAASGTMPVEATTPAPKGPADLLDRAKAILVASGFDTEANEKILNNTELTEAQRVKDISVKFRMGSEIKRALLNLAADAGNDQAQYDLKVVNGEIVPKPPVTPSTPAPFAAPIQDAPVIAAAEPASTFPLSPAEQFAQDHANNIAPKPIGNEAGRCILGLGEKGSRVINTLCSVFKNTIMPNDHVLMQSADGSLEMPYVHDGDAPKETELFLDQTRRDFRDTIFMPLMKSQLN